MHEKNFEKIQIETLKIIKEIEKILDDVKAVEQSDYETRVFSKSKIDENKRILSNETKKIKNLEYVVAVVGTMKAGKSMTINAIVGQEVLPSREFPMTTLPTLITHVPGQREPILNIKQIEPFIALQDEVQKCLSNKNDKKISELQDIQNLIRRIEKKEIVFKNTYKGQREILSFLKEINDLMRVAKEFDLDIPYREYTNVDDLPRIDVEFYHLSKYVQESWEARLTLLDTPGPDEFKQSEVLKNIFQEQLKNASAVALVVDYTKMNNESDMEVKQQIVEVADMIGKKHLFVLLNKFDQRNHDIEDDESFNEAKRLISQEVLKEKIDEKNVFPISSKSAFYANIGQREIDENGVINMELPWVNSFGDTVIGRRWKKYIDDPKEVEECCQVAWEDSYFEKPLKDIITKIHNEALILALDAPLGKINDMLRVFGNAFKAKKSSYVKSIEILKDDIDFLKNDIEKMKAVSDDLRGEVEESLESIKSKIDIEIQNQLKGKEEEFKHIFEVEWNGDNQPEKSTIWERLNQDILIDKKRKEKHDRLVKEGKVEFNSETAAEEFMEPIKSLYDESIHTLTIDSEEKMATEVAEFIPKINQNFQAKLGDTLEKIKQRLGEEIDIKIPVIKLESIESDVEQTFGESIKKNSRNVDKTYFGASFMRAIDFFDKGWGKEEKDVYIITRDKIDKSIDFAFNKISEQMKKSIDSAYTTHIQETLNKHLILLEEEIEGYRAEMMDTEKKLEADGVNIEEEISLAENMIKRTSKLSERANVAKTKLTAEGSIGV